MDNVPLKEHLETQLEMIKEAVEKAEGQFDRHIDLIDEKIHDLEAISFRTSLFVSIGTSIAVGVVIFVVGHFIVK